MTEANFVLYLKYTDILQKPSLDSAHCATALCPDDSAIWRSGAGRDDLMSKCEGSNSTGIDNF